MKSPAAADFCPMVCKRDEEVATFSVEVPKINPSTFFFSAFAVFDFVGSTFFSKYSIPAFLTASVCVNTASATF